MNASATTSMDIQPDVQSLLKKCPLCSEAILKEAKKCRYCGEFFDPELRASAKTLSQPEWNPSIAAVLSLLLPGGGHIYRGKVVKGFLWLILVAIGYGFYLIPGLILHLVSVSFAAMGNPMEG